MSTKKVTPQEDEVKENDLPETPQDIQEEPVMTQEEWLNERVPFFAIKDDGKYKDDIVQTVNGKNWQIKRGEHITIPRFVYLAIMDAEAQKGEAYKVSQGFIDEFESASRK